MRTLKLLTPKLVGPRFAGPKLAVVVVVLGVLVVGAQRWGPTWDLTSSKSATLSPGTRRVLAQLKEPIRVTAVFARSQPGRAEVSTLLSRYREVNSRISFALLDPQASPGEVSQLNAPPGSAVIEAISRPDRELAPYATEIDITSAISRLVRGIESTLCITRGHAERETATPQGVDAVLNLWESSGYKIRLVDLLTAQTSLDNCDALVVLAPTRPFEIDVVDAISSYLAEGHGALIASDPFAQGGNLNDVVKPWALTFEPGVIVEAEARSRLPEDLLSPIVTRYTEGLDAVANVGPVYFPGAQAIAVGRPTREALSVASAATTSNASYLERDIGDGSFNPDRDLSGPLTVIATADMSSVSAAGAVTRTRIAAVGDVDFLSNAYLGEFDNARLAVSLIDWMTQPEDVADAASNFPEVRPLVMTQARKDVMLVTTAAAPALMFLLAGAFLWILRRGR